ncbi:MAG: DNA mismatch repair endonuclease MutL [Dysgonomonas sp.]
MSDIIHLLPDSIANQIAAGEVIQRPASVVKELVENAVDAGADSIQIIIKDSGRTLIQVIDNGKGMSATDARLAFERHATSKIKSVDDLFSLRTMGFRGEALPSIAAVSQVELRTKRPEDETGTFLSVSASKVEQQEATMCQSGSNFSVKNIFFNVPARRKFLKSNETEKRNIITELERIVLVNPDIEFTFIDNDIESLKYPVGGLKQRIVSVAGKNFNQQLIPIEIETSLGRIHGYIGKPESARKSRAMQFFFVNGRYMRHPYFAKAVTVAYEHLIPAGESPNFFIYFEVDPSTIDVNIHPTKTEIKFENEQAIWQIITATVKEALGKSNEIPSIDFDTRDAVNIPVFEEKPIVQPKVSVDPSYNPFKTSGKTYQRPQLNWETLYKEFEKDSDTKFSNTEEKTLHFDENEKAASQGVLHYQYKNKYILTSVKNGLMIIDQRRAHIRILFDGFLSNIKLKRGVAQRVLFPEIIEFSPSEASMIPYLLEEFEAVGFDLSNLGNNSYSVNAIPSELENINPVDLIHGMVTNSIETASDVKEEIQESLALSLAYSAAITYGSSLSQEELTEIVDKLFMSSNHNLTPDHKPIIKILADDDMDKMFR